MHWRNFRIVFCNYLFGNYSEREFLFTQTLNLLVMTNKYGCLLTRVFSSSQTSCHCNYRIQRNGEIVIGVQRSIHYRTLFDWTFSSIFTNFGPYSGHASRSFNVCSKIISIPGSNTLNTIGQVDRTTFCGFLTRAILTWLLTVSLCILYMSAMHFMHSTPGWFTVTNGQ